MCVCVCVCVLWGLMQPSVESKTLATNTIVYSAKGYTSVGSSGSLKHWQKKITWYICILSYYYCNYIANLKALGADSLVLRTRSGV